MRGRTKLAVGLIALCAFASLASYGFGGTDKKAAAAWSWRDGDDLDACRLAWNQSMPCACDGKSPDCPCKPHDKKPEGNKPADDKSADKPIEGIAASLNEAIVIAVEKRRPIVAFYNQPVRAIAGAIAYRVNPKDGLKGIWVGGVENGIIGGFEISATATDAEIISRFPGKAVAVPVQQPAYFYVPQSSCPGGNCRIN